jgi:hypothetical protein
MRTVISLALLAMLLPFVVVRAGADPLLEQLRLDHAAWTTVEHDFRARRKSGHLIGVEASDYAAYVARLQRRVAEDCAALALAGVPVPAGLSCPRFESATAGRPAAIDQAAEQSREEHIAGLDAELAAGLADFDELLLREQERVKAAASRSATGGGIGADGERPPGSARQAGETVAADGSATVSAQPSTGGSADRGASPGAGGGPVRSPSRGATRQPPGIPDGSDDDVVARQLREAAEKENDPELQKRLWEEYRKYKQGIR